MGRVFANGPGDLGLIPGGVIPKTLKMVLDTSLLDTQQYKVGIKGKVEESREKSSVPATPQCSSYWKGSLMVALDYGCQLYIYIYIYIYIYLIKLYIFFLKLHLRNLDKCLFLFSTSNTYIYIYIYLYIYIYIYKLNRVKRLNCSRIVPTRDLIFVIGSI